MPSSDAAAKRGLRDSVAGRAALLVGVLVAAFVVAQSCGSRDTDVTKEEAAEIARERIDFEPDQVMTRFIPRGVGSRPAWAVSLSTDGSGGRLENVTVVVVDAEQGDVLEIRKQG